MKIGRPLTPGEVKILDALLTAALKVHDLGLIDMRQTRMADDSGNVHLVSLLVFPDEILEKTETASDALDALEVDPKKVN